MYCGKAQRAGVLDVGDHQAARAVLSRHVHGKAEVDFLFHDAEQFARGIGSEGVVEAGIGLNGADDRPSR